AGARHLRPLPVAGERARARERDRTLDGGVPGKPDPPGEPPAPPLRGPAAGRERRARDAGSDAAGRRARADPPRPAGLGRQAGRGRATARPLAPDPLPQAQSLRNLVNRETPWTRP